MAKLAKRETEDEVLDNQEVADAELEDEVLDEDISDEEENDEEFEDETDLEESAASDTLHPNSMPVGPANKAAAIAKVVNAMAGMDKETINKFVATINQIGHEADDIPSSDAEKNKSSIDTKPSGAAAQLVTKLSWNNEEVEEVSTADLIKEDVSAIFEGEELTEEFKTKVSTLIESVINLKVDQMVVSLQEEYEEKFDAELDTITENLVATVDEYLEYATSEWMSKNEVAIESSIKNDLTEEFIENLKALFETHYITVPEDRVDVVEEMSERIEALELSASEKIDEINELRAALAEKEATLVVTEMAKGLTESESEKLFELAESVDFKSIEDLKEKVGILKEQNFGGEKGPKASEPKVLFEETEKLEDEADTPKLRGPMASYVETLSRTIRK